MRSIVVCCCLLASIAPNLFAQSPIFPPLPCLVVEAPVKMIFIRADGTRYATFGGNTGWFREKTESDESSIETFNPERTEAPPRFRYTRENGEVFHTVNGLHWSKGETLQNAVTAARKNSVSQTEASAIAITNFDVKTIPDQVVVTYGLQGYNFVTLSLLSQKGEELSRIVETELSPGQHMAHISTTDLPSGTYFARLAVGEVTSIQPVFIAK